MARKLRLAADGYLVHGVKGESASPDAHAEHSARSLSMQTSDGRLPALSPSSLHITPPVSSSEKVDSGVVVIEDGDPKDGETAREATKRPTANAERGQKVRASKNPAGPKWKRWTQRSRCFSEA